MAAIVRPTGVEPEKATLAVIGCRTRASPTAPDPVTRLITPAGTPAAASTTSRTDSGVVEAGLITTLQPASRAGANLITTRLIGKFHGAISTHGPIGSWRTTDSAPLAGNGRMSSVSR